MSRKRRSLTELLRGVYADDGYDPADKPFGHGLRERLRAICAVLAAPIREFSPHGTDLFGDVNKGGHASGFGERFLLPPFTVLNARDGWWQDRKRAWIALGIQSELGRGGG